MHNDMLIWYATDDGCVTYTNLRKKTHVFTVTATRGEETIEKTINFEIKFGESFTH